MNGLGERQRDPAKPRVTFLKVGEDSVAVGVGGKEGVAQRQGRCGDAPHNMGFAVRRWCGLGHRMGNTERGGRAHVAPGAGAEATALSK